jgi:hypothetical protein
VPQRSALVCKPSAGTWPFRRDGGGVGLDGLVIGVVDDDVVCAGLVELDVVEDQRAVGLVGQQRPLAVPLVTEGLDGARGADLEGHVGVQADDPICRVPGDDDLRVEVNEGGEARCRQGQADGGLHKGPSEIRTNPALSFSKRAEPRYSGTPPRSGGGIP